MKEIIINCANDKSALKALNDIIENVAVYPKGGIKLEHTFEKLHISDIDVLEMMEKIESCLGATEKRVFGNDDSWKKLKTVKDVIEKVVDFAKKEIFAAAKTEQGALEIIKAIAQSEYLLEDDSSINLKSTISSLGLESLDCAVIISRIDEIFDVPGDTSIFPLKLGDLKTVGDFVKAINSSEYVKK